ncbi:FAD/NAD-P-binding domain-containing protein [Auriscalpium vulgare]|uniref:FAD/NAD-P-binding domain-containing protein n=1 Tax=Auriscalpium vulgare TaxID=40419 RepID=A0ACB8S9L5_9AGAM|nr:FAD/NAD-P-binding domain-containing protein [Auriscalpium vulgare]
MQHHAPAAFTPPAVSPAAIPIDPVPPLHAGRKAAIALHIVVVGAGLGGLAATHTLAHAGHRVTLLEAASAIGDVGAGIQVSPNATRLLQRWGLASALQKSAVCPEAIVFRRYDTGERVGYTRWGSTMARDYGAPYYHIHRADYHAMLLRLAQAAPGVQIRLGASVVDVQPDPNAQGGPSVTLASGEVVHADLIVAADGVKSRLQAVVIGREAAPRPTGDAAYRATVPTELMMQDPELREFVETPDMTAWMAPGRHLMAYCIRGKKEYNLVLLHPDDGSVESWTADGSAEKMRADFADFEPRVKKLLSFVDSTLKWRLMDRSPLPTWVHPKGRLVLLGDACHPMLPYRAQGAAMAIEDAAVLGNLLSRISAKEQLPGFLHAYQEIRYTRASEVQSSSRLNQHIFHLPDGPEQRARDAAMRDAMAAEFDPAAASNALEGNPNQWADRSKSQALFGYDTDLEADRWWEERGRALPAQSQRQVQGKL